MINGFSVSNISERQIPMMRRTLGVIFQDFRLIEKKTVYENLAFVMRAVGTPMKEIKQPHCLCAAAGGTGEEGQTATPASCPAASSSGWPLPGRW